ncbi:hypothetical protein ACJX0J_027139 [Zea mays]
MPCVATFALEIWTKEEKAAVMALDFHFLTGLYPWASSSKVYSTTNVGPEKEQEKTEASLNENHARLKKFSEEKNRKILKLEEENKNNLKERFDEVNEIFEKMKRLLCFLAA